MVPTWLHVLAVFALSVGVICAIAIALDELHHPQRMWVMNVVWPVVALFGTLISLWAYFRYGRLATLEAAAAAEDRGREPPNRAMTPFRMIVAKGTSHCGAGCTLGDIIAEWLAFFFPAIAVWLGWNSVFDEKMFAVWILDYVFAFAIGIAFQYFTIVPMRNLSPGRGLIAAVKADAASLTAWQVGMYGFMAFANLYIFRHVLGARLQVDSLEFWFMMQLAMICGFITAYPVNWWLVRAGIKEKM